MRTGHAASAATTWPRAGLVGGRLRRPLIFAAVGLTSGGVQLGLLEAFENGWGWHLLLANVVAFTLASQVNLALHSVITWRDRPLTGPRDFAARWGRFMGTVGSTALLNQLIFVVLLHWLPDVVAAGSASMAISLLNYGIGNRYIFHQAPVAPEDAGG